VVSSGRAAGYRLLGTRLDYLLHLRPAEWPIMAAHTAVGYLLAVGLGGAAAVALVHAEGEKAPSPADTLGTTSSFAYARLRKREGYTDDEVDAWAARFRPMLDAGKDVYAYFRHDDTGANALSAERLRDRLAA